jgi:hypothetical protein
MTRCSVCADSRVNALNTALQEGCTLREIAGQFACSPFLSVMLRRSPQASRKCRLFFATSGPRSKLEPSGHGEQVRHVGRLG